MKRKVIKSGRLYHFPIDCPDIEKGILRRLFRRFGIAYVPFSLRFYSKLFLREAKSKYNRALVEFCRKHHIETYIVNEGASPSTHGHIPMRADYFVCLKKDIEKWVRAGIARGQILTYEYDRSDYKDLLFLTPFFLYERDFVHPWYWGNNNSSVLKIIEKYLKKPVMFKLHRKNIDVCKHFIPPHRLITGDADELIRKYNKIYCFSFSSIKIDVEMAGKKPILVDKEVGE